MRSFWRRGLQVVRRSRNKRALTEWEIQRKLERFRLYQIETQLDGLSKWEEAEADVNALRTLLRAGIRPSRCTMDRLVYGPLRLGFYIAYAADLTEQDVAYRGRLRPQVLPR